MIKVLFFGPIAESVGQRTLDIEFTPGMCVASLRDQLAQRYPEAFRQVSFVAVNGVQVREFSLAIDEGAEIAFMAKFSGG